ncbi:effector-associated domain EAD1-containing protein [Frankia sp. QA3]|uniref:effector-associated domain EAD1-containing protein n=1 Tax=Frankia sp. QA3 TaxID=710111 RepID=UPI000269BF23|nr:effector-associated domain EAD1-containing protein [Frankia sp. QA3]EIV91492.1 hypothetical protein FraQA3DRAFT_0947 [Frankia sp. QA3]
MQDARPPDRSDIRSEPVRSSSAVRLTVDEREELHREIARLFRAESGAEIFLRRLGYPLDRVPARGIAADPEQWWDIVFFELDSGIIDDPDGRLLRAALRVYPYNEVFAPLGERKGISPFAEATDEGEVAVSPAANLVLAVVDEQRQGRQHQDEESSACHVIVRASSEEERSHAIVSLADAGLSPVEVWSTEHAISFQVDEGDPAVVRAILDTTDLSWTIVPPGAPDYMLGALYVRGPDGRRFRLLDAPANQTVGNVAQTVIAQQYADASVGEFRSTVVDLEGPENEVRRLDEGSTLHDAGVRDGDQLRVAFEATAG